MGCDTCSIEPIVPLVFRIGVSVIGLSVLLLLGVLGLRLRRRAEEERRARCLAHWRPLFAACTAGSRAALSQLRLPIRRADRLTFQHLWVYYHESLRGEAKEHLNHLARRVGMDQVARRWLRKGHSGERLLALATLGHLRERSAWEELRQIAAAEHPDLSLAAAHALVRIDAAQALAVLTPLIGTRMDWSPPRVLRLLREAGYVEEHETTRATPAPGVSPAVGEAERQLSR